MLSNKFPSAFAEIDGHKTFIVVDDYTSCCIWDELDDKLDADIAAVRLTQMADDSLYFDAGIRRPRLDQLPAVFCVEHGVRGSDHIFNATVESAMEFIGQRTGAKQ